MKNNNVLKAFIIMAVLIIGIIGLDRYISYRKMKDLTNNKSRITSDVSSQSDYIIFDAKKLIKATKSDVDSLLGIEGIQDENEPYTYNYGKNSAVFDDNGYCIIFFLDDVEDYNYKISDEESILRKYGIDLKGSKATKNSVLDNYSDIKDFQEIDIWHNKKTSSIISSISFFPEGSKKSDNFLIQKSNEFNSQKSSDNKKQEEKDFVINEDPILCNANGECSLRQSAKEMTDDELRIARNEIYARHGYRFKEGKYKRYFEKQSWYNPTNDDSVEVDKTLTKKEKECVNLILDEEEKRGLTENFD